MKTPKSLKIAVVGGGLMGHGIAQEFAQAGYPVAVFEEDRNRRSTILDRIDENLRLLTRQGATTPKEARDILGRIRITETLEKAVAGADYVIEAVFEDLSLKQSLFKHLDTLCPPHVILASNSSSFTPTEYAKETVHPERILGTHYFNPPYLIPLVEIVKGKATSEKTLTLAASLLKKIGKRVVYVRKESPGFIANRIQIALFREAFHVVEQGIATPEEVDLAIKNSFGRRLGIMGPFEQCDVIGADLKLAIYKALIPHISHRQESPPLLKDQVKTGNLGMKTGQGFYRWTAQSIQAMNTKLGKWLLGIQRLENTLTSSSTKDGKPEDEGQQG